MKELNSEASFSYFNSSQSHYSPDFYYYCHLEGLLREQCAEGLRREHFEALFNSISLRLFIILSLSSASCQVAAIKTSDLDRRNTFN